MDSQKEKIIRIAIDGPGGAGKSTIAKKLASILDIDYIDTGAMYRAIAIKLMAAKWDSEDFGTLDKVLEQTDIVFDKGHIFLDGECVDEEIRTTEAAESASVYSALPQVREKLVALQRKIGAEKSVVMDGRDIGSNVLKDAEFKFFLTADLKERAARRLKDFQLRGEEVTLEQVIEDLAQRDLKDMTREINPLKQAEDAIEVDSTGKSIEEVLNFLIKKISA